MTESFPISCISCRRKKIKCNKKKPCNQCERRSIVCRFPSTFRNIKIDEGELLDPLAASAARAEISSSSGADSSEFTTSSYGDDLELMKRHNQRLLEENFRLELGSRKLTEKLAQQSRSVSVLESTTESSKTSIHVSGETSEGGEKYYGPQSSSYMMDNLRDNSGNDTETSNQSKVVKEVRQEDPEEARVRLSLKKKNLPCMLGGDPHLNMKDPAVVQRNIKVIQRLIEFFFTTNSYYTSFIIIGNVREFLDSYESIKDSEWENDDDLLLLYMILLMAVQRLSPSQFVKFGLLPQDKILEVSKFKSYLSKDVLHHSFVKFRHNLLNESIVTIQAYILCCEWYFIDQKYEECWSMVFHVSAVAYLIGLHVLSRFKLGNNKKDTSEMDEKEDLEKCVVWFALRNITGQICSILGRPNPISIQVNSFVNRSTRTTRSDDLDFKENKTQVALKSGLSECLRLSNMMLIENYMIDFTINDLFNLNRKFETEITQLEMFLTDKSADMELNFENASDQILSRSKIGRSAIMHDLIIFYVNRSKLFEPFVDKFRMHEQADEVVRILINSLDRFLIYSVEFIGNFIDDFGEKLSGSANTLLEKHFGKLFRTYFPFLNSFIYQGFVVIFTFLHYKFKEFIEAPSVMNLPDLQAIDYEKFLIVLDEKLNLLYSFESRLLAKLSKNIKFWSTNILYLMNNNIRFIKTMQERRQQRILNERFGDYTQMMMEDDSQLDDAYYISLSDPFWLSNPENLPYYLSSPSDDGRQQGLRSAYPEGNKSSSSDIEQPQPLHVQPSVGNEGNWLMPHSSADDKSQTQLKAEGSLEYINPPFEFDPSDGADLFPNFNHQGNP